MKKRVTLKDIARENGVHVSTVSRALDPHSKSPLTQDVIDRIRESARALGYRPNHLAAGLRTNRSMTIGILIPDITNMIFPPIVRGIESVLEPLGYASLLVNTDNQPSRERHLFGSLQARGVDGIIHAAVVEDALSFDAKELDGIPMVTVNRRLDLPNVPCVINDDESGIRFVLEHLVRHGHSRIAHLAGPSALSTGRVRKEAFLREAARLGLEAPPARIVEARTYIESEGARCAEELLEAKEGITAIVCANDRLALGALHYLQQQGLDCPGDVSITGVNDMPMLDLVPPGLTTVRTRLFEAGKTSAEILVTMMRHPQDVVPTQTVLPVMLIERSSVGPPPAS